MREMNKTNELIPTRQSLLSRLKDWDDHESWKDFFNTYWRLIYQAAIRAGLTDAEAQDVVQETILGVLKGLPKFEYNQARGSFKGWLLRITSWRIVDQLRRRQKAIAEPRAPSDTATSTALIERVPDPAGLGLETTWDEEWESNLMDAAIERVKRKVDPKHFQVFDLYVLRKWSVSRVTRTLNVGAGNVYLIKHRVGALIRTELKQLQTKPI